MAKRELGPAALEVAQAVERVLESDAVVGVSGGADSMALALGAQWAARRAGVELRCLTVDHGLQPGSGAVADRTAETLRQRGLQAEVRRVQVIDDGQGLEAAARKARLTELTQPGLPVLLGHTLDDQAEQVLLGLLRGSGTRSLAGMAAQRGPLLRPLLQIRQATTRQACREWGIEAWEDPHNQDRRFARVRVRQHLADLREALAADPAPMLARTAHLARLDADYLDELAAAHLPGTETLSVDELRLLPEAIRLRVIKQWLETHQIAPEMGHVISVDHLISAWRGQRGASVPGGVVVRADGQLRLRPRPGLPGVGS